MMLFVPCPVLFRGLRNGFVHFMDPHNFNLVSRASSFESLQLQHIASIVGPSGVTLIEAALLSVVAAQLRTIAPLLTAHVEPLAAFPDTCVLPEFAKVTARNFSEGTD
jgi:hypothetical protein